MGSRGGIADTPRLLLFRFACRHYEGQHAAKPTSATGSNNHIEMEVHTLFSHTVGEHRHKTVQRRPASLQEQSVFPLLCPILHFVRQSQLTSPYGKSVGHVPKKRPRSRTSLMHYLTPSMVVSSSPGRERDRVVPVISSRSVIEL